MPDPRRSRRHSPDVVIPWRDEGDRGESLRYALRSLVNLPHRRVIIVGDPVPGFVQGVVNLARDRVPSRFEDSEANTQAGLALADGWAYIFHDDHFIMRPVDWIRPAHRGPLALLRGGGEYHRRARDTRLFLERWGIRDPLNFNVHLPALVDGPKYVELAVQASGVIPGYQISVYGNLSGLRTGWVHDPKVIGTGEKPNPSWPVWATSDRSFRQGLIGRMIRDSFPNPGPYEG